MTFFFTCGAPPNREVDYLPIRDSLQQFPVFLTALLLPLQLVNFAFENSGKSAPMQLSEHLEHV